MRRNSPGLLRYTFPRPWPATGPEAAMKTRDAAVTAGISLLNSAFMVMESIPQILSAMKAARAEYSSGHCLPKRAGIS